MYQLLKIKHDFGLYELLRHLGLVFGEGKLIIKDFTYFLNAYLVEVLQNLSYSAEYSDSDMSQGALL